jgi:CHASE1-domain containing sensor protein
MNMSDTPTLSPTSDYSSNSGNTPIFPAEQKDIELPEIGSVNSVVVSPTKHDSVTQKTPVDVNPVDRYDSESDHDDANKRKAKKKFWFRITIVDIILIIVAVLLICIGLAVGLISFFLLQQKERTLSQNDLYGIATLNAANVKKAVEDAVRSTTALQAVLTYANGSIDYYSQYLPFMNSSGLFSSRYQALNYAQFVTNAQRSQFEATERLQGLAYANFTIKTKDANGTYIVSPQKSYYAPVVQVFPYTAPSLTVLGYDVTSDPVKNQTINTMLSTKATALSGRVNLLVGDSVASGGAIIMAPVIVQGLIQGFALGAFYASTVINGSLDYTDTKDLVVAVIDLNNTSTNFADVLMCTTLTNAQAAAQFGPGYTVDNVTTEMLQSMYYNAPFTPPGVTIQVVDRLWAVYFVPTNAYIASYSSYQKWVALFVSIVAGIILASLIVFFTKRLQYVQYVRAITSEQVKILETSQSKLQSLLNKIAVRERKTRGTIDAIPDMIFTVNHMGRVLQTNASFDNALMYGSEELLKGLYVDRIFPNLESMFFLRQNSIESIDTEAATKEGDRVKVQVTVRNLIFSRKDKLSSTDSHAATTRDKESIETGVTSKDEIEAFVIIARNMTDREQLLEDMMKREKRYQDRMKFVDFDVQYKLSTFKKSFKKYCRSLQNPNQSADALDLLTFLDIVQGYKKLPFEHRMNQQTQLYETYMKKDAPNRLSIMNEQLTNQISLKVTKSVGDHDVFDEVEEAVKTKLVTEYYPGYVAQQPAEEESKSTHSSDEITTTTDTNTITTSGEHTDR